MFRGKFFSRGLAWAMILMLSMPPPVLFAQESAPAEFKQEELEQLLAPIALHPDRVVTGSPQPHLGPTVHVAR